MMQPRIVAELVIQQIEAQSKQDAEHTELLKAFRAFPAAIPKQNSSVFAARPWKRTTSNFFRAWQKLHDYMVASYLPHVRSIRQYFYPCKEGAPPIQS